MKLASVTRYLAYGLHHVLKNEKALQIEAIVRTPLDIIDIVNYYAVLRGLPKYERSIFQMKKNQQWTFVNMRLTPEEKKAFMAFEKAHFEDTFDYLAVLLSDGYKLSLRYDTENYAWLSTLIGTPESAYNTGSSCTSRHETLVQALLLTIFKHTELSDGKTWRDDSGQATWG